ncbi:MAG: hypothetical protein IJI59_13335, partial [Clostridia bacterium]|nr:hypothetical protein [Clostridia bacterium]
NLLFCSVLRVFHLEKQKQGLSQKAIHSDPEYDGRELIAKASCGGIRAIPPFLLGRRHQIHKTP